MSKPVTYIAFPNCPWLMVQTLLQSLGCWYPKSVVGRGDSGFRLCAIKRTETQLWYLCAGSILRFWSQISYQHNWRIMLSIGGISSVLLSYCMHIKLHGFLLDDRSWALPLFGSWSSNAHFLSQKLLAHWRWISLCKFTKQKPIRALCSCWAKYCHLACTIL